MAYALEEFYGDCREALRADPGPDGRERVRQLLERLLADDGFRSAHTADGMPPGLEQLYQDEELGFCVLNYVMPEAQRSPPHDHGDSWAVYGQLAEHTDMTEFRRSDGGSGSGEASLEETRRYRLNPGDAGLFDVGAIHSIDYPAGARFVRVTGTDLDYVPRLSFDTSSGTANEIRSKTVPE